VYRKISIIMENETRQGNRLILCQFHYVDIRIRKQGARAVPTTVLAKLTTVSLNRIMQIIVQNRNGKVGRSD